jgi:L-fuconolactonase
VIIDAHHHLWRCDPADYPWIGANDLVLRRDFGATELEAACSETGVDGTVVVQARQTLGETRWLLDQASRSPRILGVVGWVPLQDPALPGILERIAEPALVGVRHVVQDEPDPDFLLRPAVARGIDLLAGRGLVYDLLVRAAQLPQAIRCVDAHPAQRFVLDHAAKPDFTEGLEPWAGRIRDLARRPNVCCKISGLATEMGLGWTPDRLRPWVDVLLDAFGPGRLLFASDWPVCLLATGYQRWFDGVAMLIAGLTAGERAAVLGDNAVAAYRLECATRKTLEVTQ